MGRLPLLGWLEMVARTAPVAALLQCSEANGPLLSPCTGFVTLTATATLEPTFAWAPNCLVDQVTVEEDIAPSAGGPQPRWIIRSRVTGQGAGAPIMYGHLPPSMEEVLSAASLVAGHEYSVRAYAGTLEVGGAIFRP